MDLMRKMGEMIPKLTIRAKRIKQERDRHEQYKAQYEAYVEKKIEKAAGPRKKKAEGRRGRGSARRYMDNNGRSQHSLRSLHSVVTAALCPMQPGRDAS